MATTNGELTAKYPAHIEEMIKRQVQWEDTVAKELLLKRIRTDSQFKRELQEALGIYGN